jgi:hypothetical protein
MIDLRTLQHMYQAWMQGNPDYIRDWCSFVEFAAKQYGTTGDNIMRELQKYTWFEKGEE